jgi:hypothetical protein
VIYDWDGRQSRRKSMSKMAISAIITISAAAALGALLLQYHIG